MSAPPYMKLYIADYHGDTTHLSALEHGVYLLLLMAMWRHGGKLPADDQKLAKLGKVGPGEWAKLRDVILPFFKRSGGRLTHKRILAELAKYEAVSAKRKEASEKGVSQKARKKNALAPASGYPNGNQMVAKPEPEPESSLEPSFRGSKSTRRERSEARLDGASGLRVVAGGEAEAWRRALAEAQHDLPHFASRDPDFASEIGEFIGVALDKLLSMQEAA